MSNDGRARERRDRVVTTKARGMASAMYAPNHPGRYFSKKICTAYVVYAPSMSISPWAMLMTPIRPKRDRKTERGEGARWPG